MASIFKKHWTENHLQFPKTCQKSSITIRSSIHPIVWHHHKNRKTSICLHRLRSGHHRLNSFSHRIDHEVDPSCRYGCEAIENTEHILLNCPKNEPHCLKIRQLCLDNSLELNSETILGLNTSLDTKTELKIRDLTAIFLSKSGLINILLASRGGS